MKRTAFLLSVFMLLHIVSYSQMNIVEIAGKQTIMVECAHPFEEKPLRNIPITFTLTGKPIGKKASIKIHLKAGPGQLVSDPIIHKPEMIFEAKDFPAMNTTAAHITNQVSVLLSKATIERSEKFWIWIDGQEKGGTVEVTVACTSNEQNKTDSQPKKKCR